MKKGGIKTTQHGQKCPQQKGVALEQRPEVVEGVNHVYSRRAAWRVALGWESTWAGTRYSMEVNVGRREGDKTQQEGRFKNESETRQHIALCILESLESFAEGSGTSWWLLNETGYHRTWFLEDCQEYIIEDKSKNQRKIQEKDVKTQEMETWLQQAAT